MYWLLMLATMPIGRDDTWHGRVAGYLGFQHITILAPTASRLQMDDIKQFRQWGSKTPGHPENFITEGVEVTTGAALPLILVELITRVLFCTSCTPCTSENTIGKCAIPEYVPRCKQVLFTCAQCSEVGIFDGLDRGPDSLLTAMFCCYRSSWSGNLQCSGHCRCRGSSRFSVQQAGHGAADGPLHVCSAFNINASICVYTTLVRLGHKMICRLGTAFSATAA